MTVPPEPDPGRQPDPAVPFRIDQEPFAGFELTVLVDRAVYSAADAVRITVSAANRGDRFVEHRYPGWQRCVLTVHDHLHREVADDRIERFADGPACDRFAPGQSLLAPTYWAQTAGPLVPGWSDDPPGPRVPPGRYRIRAAWLGREPGHRSVGPEAWSGWFELL